MITIYIFFLKQSTFVYLFGIVYIYTYIKGYIVMLEIDVFCPLYNSENYITRLIEGIKSQENVIVKDIVFSVTESQDDTLELAKKYGTKIFEVKKSQFSHSLTREIGMSLCSSNIVVFLSDDVIIKDKYLFYNLTKDIGRNNIVYTFAHQITNSNGIEKYTREKNYPKTSYVVSRKDIDTMQIKAFYSSDACAAYDRITFNKLNGYDNKDMKVSEDMYYCRKVLLNDLKIKYCCDAIVTHSHNLSINQVYHRYIDIGTFFRQNPEFKEYRSVDSGLSLAKYILSRAIREKNLPVIFRFLPDMFARFLGKAKGEKHDNNNSK